jgi:hypothetical protein
MNSFQLVIFFPKLHHLLLQRHISLLEGRGSGFTNVCIILAICPVSSAAVASWPLAIALFVGCQLTIEVLLIAHCQPSATYLRLLLTASFAGNWINEVC